MSEPSAASSIESIQLERLRSLIDAIGETNAFHAPRLRAAGVDGSIESIDSFIERMPLTTKDELARDQLDHPPYGSNLTFPIDAYARLHQTSSTTGRLPIRWVDRAEDWDWMTDGWIEILEAAGVSSRDRVFVAFSFGPFIGFWLAFDAAARMGCLTIPGGAMNSVTRLRVMLAHGATVLCATPTYAIRLGEVARAEGIDLASAALRSLIVAGEPGGVPPVVRGRIESLWPTARVYDHYGMTEVGPVTYQCAERTDAVHLRDDAYLAEVIEPATGAAWTPDADTPGELVLTTLGRVGSPLLRYRTGDLVRPLPRSRCACGRTTLQLEGGIIGRADDMICVRGVNLYPIVVDQIVRGIDGVAEYRVDIDESGGMAELTLIVEPEPDIAADAARSESLCAQLVQAFRATYNLRVPVATADPGTLPRFELKSRRWHKPTKAAP